MKKLLFIIACIISVQSFGQVDSAVSKMIDSKINALPKQAQVSKAVIYQMLDSFNHTLDSTILCKLTSPTDSVINVDTLKLPAGYQARYETNVFASAKSTGDAGNCKIIYNIKNISGLPVVYNTTIANGCTEQGILKACYADIIGVAGGLVIIQVKGVKSIPINWSVYCTQMIQPL